MITINHFKKNWKNYLILLLVILFLGNILIGSNIGLYKNSFSKSLGFSQSEIISDSRAMIGKNLESFSPDVGNRLVIKNANINLESDNYDGSYVQIKNSANKFNAIILSESEYKNDKGDRSLNLNLRIKSIDLDSIVNEIKNYGEITNLNIYSNDVTKSYEDYTNRSIRYQNQIKKYYLMLDKKNITIDEEIKVQQRIDQLEDLIFNLENNKANLKENVDYSLIYINLVEKPSFIDKSNFKSFKDSIVEFLSSLDSGIQFILKLLGFILPFVIIYGIYRLFRRFLN